MTHQKFCNCSRYVARLGELDLKRDDDGATPIDILIQDRKVHEGDNPTSFTNDIAILKLQDDVTFTSKFITSLEAILNASQVIPGTMTNMYSYLRFDFQPCVCELC